MATLRKSVTVDRELLDRLGPERTRNLSATVNQSLRLLAPLDAQQELIDEWAAEHGPLDEDLRPFLESAVRAQIESRLRILTERRAAPR